jgi:hypothetical protein
MPNVHSDLEGATPREMADDYDIPPDELATEGAIVGKDLPGMTPNKINEFPDGFFDMTTLTNRRETSMVNSRRGISMSILFIRYPPTCNVDVGFINAVGVFQTYYEQVQLRQYTAFQIGWISSFLVFCMNLGVSLY